ncbi:hypothetical protein F8538_07995 [Edwardsiella ictaluri]|uniref:hypothetical protein n=1 Tax=Edwardsiella ictaluri TaxID=67780 RepID=UPI0009C0DAEB|nr:hypothetical protein [Edwardsiella ictaluri]ARD38346.1 hypothetical protein B6E78_02040 [Edwardsiella ictaluri]QPW26764.1 hypothetical protein F8538_07995 [Edwardsiella ictaluri]
MAEALIGFVLLVSPCGHNACDALPVTEDIYPTRTECQQMINRLHQRRPGVVLLCSEVYRDENAKPR